MEKPKSSSSQESARQMTLEGLATVVLGIGMVAVSREIFDEDVVGDIAEAVGIISGAGTSLTGSALIAGSIYWSLKTRKMDRKRDKLDAQLEVLDNELSALSE